MGALGPVAQQRPGLARVDDLLDSEALGRPERRADRVEAGFYLRAKRTGIGRRLELSPVGGLDPPLDRKRAPVGGGPRVAEVEPLGVSVCRSCDTVDLADENRYPRHGGLVDGEERPRSTPD